MRVLQVNDADLRGRRFNGFDLLSDLGERGIEAHQVVLTKESDDPRVRALLAADTDVALNDALWRVEQDNSMNALLYPWARTLRTLPEFHEADVVHYHLIHNRMLSLLDLPALFAEKPAVWTFHDAWPLTGHCIQPASCTGWQSECTPCPHVDRWFSLDSDCAGPQWRLKRRVYSKLDADVVVASRLMQRMFESSPLPGSGMRPHLVPFGVRGDDFLADGARAESRRTLGLPEHDITLLLRAAPGQSKGTDKVIEALTAGSFGGARVTVLALDGVGVLRSLPSQFNVVEYGWVRDQALYARLLSACDIFLMPSPAESFGMMALEAMAAGRPVVCFNDTAVEELIAEPECGLAVPLGDASALRTALERLAADGGMRERLGRQGRAVAAQRYAHDQYVDALVAVYEEASSRGSSLR